MRVKVVSLMFAGGYNSVYEQAWNDSLENFIDYYNNEYDIEISFDLFNNKLGFQILPSTRAKYKKGDEMYFATGNYKDCEIKYLSAKNDAIVFVVTKTEALKHNLIQEVEYE